MHLARYGNGSRAFVGLHGWSGDQTTFAPLLPWLPEDALLFSADLPGCGASPAPDVWSLQAVAGEVVDAVERLGVERVTLVGNCSGALIGLVAARRVPELFGRLVLIDPFAFFPWYFRIFLAGELGRRAYFSTFANPLGRRLTNLSLRSRRAETTDLTASFAGVDHETTYRYLLLLKEIESTQSFASLRMPINIVHGERTFAAVKRSAAMWREVWPHAGIHAVVGAGHLPIEERPEEVARLIFTERPIHRSIQKQRTRKGDADTEHMAADTSYAGADSRTAAPAGDRSRAGA